MAVIMKFKNQKNSTRTWSQHDQSASFQRHLKALRTLQNDLLLSDSSVRLEHAAARLGIELKYVINTKELSDLVYTVSIHQ